MIVLLGSTGYVGSAFETLLKRKGIAHIAVSRTQVDYSRPAELESFLTTVRPAFLVNCAGYTGKPNVDACEFHKAECLMGNAVLPGMIRQACERLGVPWGHVSSGCIYTGTREDGGGFRETDVPNFSFRTNNCSFYSGTKALGEECLLDAQNVYIWRLRIPFNHIDSKRNYLSKLMRYENLLQATNSISHLDEFVEACLECWLQKVPFGIYNVTNTGAVTTSEVVDLIKKHLKIDREFRFFESEEQFMAKAAKAPRSNCTMDNSKLLSTGVAMSEVHDAIAKSLRHGNRRVKSRGGYSCLSLPRK